MNDVGMWTVIVLAALGPIGATVNLIWQRKHKPAGLSDAGGRVEP